MWPSLKILGLPEKNARAIADKAGVVYDKIRGFVEDLDKLGKQLSTLHMTYDGVMNKLTHGHGNLIRQASSFVDLGVKVKKTIPRSITEQVGFESDKNQNLSFAYWTMRASLLYDEPATWPAS